jgi:DNA-directed RNA polymerase subunit RPC12/RpoP
MIDPQPAAPGQITEPLDRELRCVECGARSFSALAPELHQSGFACPRCSGHTELVPDTHEHQVV